MGLQISWPLLFWQLKCAYMWKICSCLFHSLPPLMENNSKSTWSNCCYLKSQRTHRSVNFFHNSLCCNVTLTQFSWTIRTSQFSVHPLPLAGIKSIETCANAFRKYSFFFLIRKKEKEGERGKQKEVNSWVVIPIVQTSSGFGKDRLSWKILPEHFQLPGLGSNLPAPS